MNCINCYLVRVCLCATLCCRETVGCSMYNELSLPVLEGLGVQYCVICVQL